MKRAPIVLTGTALGVAGVLSFQPRAPDIKPATAVSASVPATPSESGAKTYLGNAIDTQYGPAQVRVTIKDGRIVRVEAVQLQGNDPKSVQISTSAEPTLRASALQRQSADIDAVSGATVTSSSYEASLQSALDKAAFQSADGSRGSSEVPEVEEHHGPGGQFGGPGGQLPPTGALPDGAAPDGGTSPDGGGAPRTTPRPSSGLIS